MPLQPCPEQLPYASLGFGGAQPFILGEHGAGLICCAGWGRWGGVGEIGKSMPTVVGSVGVAVAARV